MSKGYYIPINGKDVEVTKEVFDAYMRPVWREKKRQAVRAGKERSMDYFEGGADSFPSRERLVEDIAEDKILLEGLFSALETLTEDDRELIDALYFREQSERAYAREINVPRTTITYRRDKVIKKLRKIFGMD